MNTLIRVALLGTGLALITTGCADRVSTRSQAPRSAPAHGAPGVSASRTTSSRPSMADQQADEKSPKPAANERPDRTGIAACDDYLDSYKACHRAAGIYRTDDIDNRYNMIRNTLLHDAKDSAARPELAARCNALASTLRQALHGKSCDTDTAPAEPSSATP